MTKPHVLQMGSYPEWDQTPLDAAYTLHAYHTAPDKAAFLAEVGPQIRAIATNGGLGAPTQVIAACPALEVISIYGVGFDAVDLALCRARGIHVTNTPDVLTDDCADLAVGMVLALARGIVKAEAWARADWTRAPFPLQRRVTGMRAGILGLGRIGVEVAKRLEGFRMEIAYSARSAKDVPYTYISDPVTLAARSDVLIVTAAASAETRHIVSPAVIAALGPAGLLVNISRASNVDEAALLSALLQPHHASGTVETRRAMGQLMRENLTAHFAGLPLPTPVI